MRLQLSLWADSLSANPNSTQTLDPFAVVTELPRDGPPKKLGQTEVIPNTTNPDWTAVFFIEDFELGNDVQIVVSVCSGKSCLGSCIFDVNGILGAPGSMLAKTLKADSDAAIVVLAEPATNTGVLSFQLHGSFNLLTVQQTTAGWQSNKLDPFFVLQRPRYGSDHDWDTVVRSPVIKDNWNPNWPIGTIEVSTLCGGNYNQPLRLVVYHYESSGGQPVEIASVMMTLQQLLAAAPVQGTTSYSTNDAYASAVDVTKAFTLVSKSGQEVGRMVVWSAKIIGLPTATATAPAAAIAANQPVVVPEEQEQVFKPSAPYQHPVPTFASYMAGGCQLHALIAIDFTATNGDPRELSSLHFLAANNGELNAYESAIVSICPLLANYDSDQKYPLWGFGAKLSSGLSHCFQVGPEPEVDQVYGVLETYRKFLLSGITLSSPRDFSEIITRAAKQANTQSQQGHLCYSILLILTNGDPDDALKTKEALKQIQDVPLSVVVVGVGNGPFSAIQQMERDLERSTTNRNMFRFAPFSALQNDPVQLRRVALERIPDQLVSYFVSHKIYPQPPLPVVAAAAAAPDVVLEPYGKAADITVPMVINDAGEAIIVGGVPANQRTGYLNSLVGPGIGFGHSRNDRRCERRWEREQRRLYRRGRYGGYYGGYYGGDCGGYYGGDCGGYYGGGYGGPYGGGYGGHYGGGYGGHYGGGPYGGGCGGGYGYGTAHAVDHLAASSLNSLSWHIQSWWW